MRACFASIPIVSMHYYSAVPAAQTFPQALLDIQYSLLDGTWSVRLN
eukprot:SAG31_NODE_2845_length_5009_cov_1.983299_8_plen_47_part_00